MKKLLSFLAMALLFVACQNDAGQELSNDALVSVKLNVTAQDLTTRADDATAVAGYSSALGAIQNFTTEDWAKYDLRYTLEVYAAGDNGSGTAIGNARQIKTVDSYKEVFFEVRLAPNKNYKFVVFADFVNQGEQSDLYYNTEDLRAITMMDGKMNPMDEARDAYFASKELLVKSNIEEPIVLQRPFGKVRAVTTDYEFVKNYAAPAKAVVTYYNCEVFKSFNAVNGAISTARSEAENTYEYEIGKDKLYTAGVDAENANMTLFADYLLAKPTAQSEVYFTLAVYAANGDHINSQDFNVAIPIQRNYLTTIKGNLLTETANIEVKIDHELKEGNTIDPEAKTLAVPTVSATLEGNAVTLTWDAVEGATSYFTRIAAEGNEFEETTECTKVYDNLAWETTYTFEVYAACAEENLVSNTTSYEITTEAEPIVVTYNIYLKNEDNWDEVYFYAWGEYATAAWPGEAMTKTTVEGEEYYVYNLPAEANGKTLSFLFNNNNNGKQTADITGVVADKDYFYTNYVEPAVTETYLYLKPNANWKVDNARFAAYFFGAGETWVDATLVEGETDIYSVAAPAGYPNVIFCRMNPGATANNWNNKWNQTADLTVPTDGTNFYTVKEDTWDNGGGTWSVYTASEPVEPEQPVEPEVVAFTSATVAAADSNLNYHNITFTDGTYTAIIKLATRGTTEYVAGVYNQNGSYNDAKSLYIGGYTTDCTWNGAECWPVTMEVIDNGDGTATFNLVYNEYPSAVQHKGTFTGVLEGLTLVEPEVEEEVVLPEFVIPGEGGTYTYDFRYTKLVVGLDAANAIRVAQDNGWIWDIKFNPGLTSIVPGDYTAVQGFTTADALEVDTYNGSVQYGNGYQFFYPDSFSEVSINVQQEGEFYCITLIGANGYSAEGKTYRLVYIGKLK